MKRSLIIYGMILPGLCLPMASSSAAQSFFDKLKKKADEIEKTASEQFTKTKEKPQGIPSGASSPSSPASPAKPDKTAVPDTLPTSGRKVARAILNLAPEIWESRPDHQLKELVRVFYPDENKTLANEFTWRKHKSDFKNRILAESANAPASFEVAPWLDNRSSLSAVDKNIDNNLSVKVGRYDFDRAAWPIYLPAGDKIRLPWIYAYGRGPVSHKISNMGPAKTHWISMPAEQAEKLDQQFNGMYYLYGHYRFTITDVIGLQPENHPDYEKYKKYMKGQYKKQILDNLKPVARVRIDQDKIDLYIKTVTGKASSRDDFKYVATIRLHAQP
ncbi:hypothetical protein [Luteithermobacter gelatinilyticus]|uniref:hypothetical protein n=1 Tax=Luteithermobacter gelatinilyticus TaxID=2582913 RepID=UPI001105B210|nr:hypothetical protein [Luteithermobacter gelatinilyticus]|tara:strand:+ start:8509 stop:9501 length:993 start_codon:yes stop_codon:yes gene_type:complete